MSYIVIGIICFLLLKYILDVVINYRKIKTDMLLESTVDKFMKDFPYPGLIKRNEKKKELMKIGNEIIEDLDKVI